MDEREYNENLTTDEKKLPLIKNDIKDKSVSLFVQERQNDSTPPKYVSLVQRKEIKKPLVGTCDTIICLVILAPCVVGFWRGTWMLLDIYKKYFTSWFCLFFGYFCHLIFVLVQDSFISIIEKKSTNTGAKIFKMIFTRFYTYIFAIANIMHWKGGWDYIDLFFGVNLSAEGVVLKEGSGIFMITATGTLICIVLLRSLRNCLAPPFIFCTDRKNNTFIVPTRFRVKMNEKKSLYILDCLFSVFIIGTLVVFVWRGAWALFDIYLFPENEVWSFWGSLIVGYSSVAIAFMLQPFMRWLCDRITGVSRILVADLFLMWSLIGTINVWRGIWNLLNIYLLPGNLELSCWITHWVCLVVLILLGCSNSLLVRGVYIDAEEPAGKCVVFPCYYLRLIFQEQKLKKLQKETEMSNVKPCENNHIVTIQNTNEQYIINHKEGNV